MVKSGVIIGASVTDSPHRPRGRKEYETVVDRREAEGGAAAAMLREVPKPNVNGEARWIRKAGQLRFGYKRHTVTDPNGIILAEATPGTSRGSYAGPTCPGASLSPPTRATPRRRIGHPAGRGFSAREQQLNAGISRTRCRIERTFDSMRRWFHGGTARYVGLARTHAQHVMEAIAHNLYRAQGLIVANA